MLYTVMKKVVKTLRSVLERATFAQIFSLTTEYTPNRLLEVAFYPVLYPKNFSLRIPGLCEGGYPEVPSSIVMNFICLKAFAIVISTS